MAADSANNEKIVQRALEAFETADERAMREDLAPDFVSHSMPPGFAEDSDGWVQLAQHLKAGTPDGKLTIHDMFAGGDKVAVRFAHAGTHQGELFGVPPSNRTVTVRGIEIYRLSGGEIAEHWGEFDTSDLFGPPGGMGDAGEGARQQS
jgi:predicted ester cyclase